MHFKFPALLAVTWVASTVFAASEPAPSGPSSEIPMRRDFPLNTNISPCENFYEYTCSGVISAFKLRDDRKSHTFAFSDSRERILERKKQFMKELDQKFKQKQPQLSERSQTLATIYGACMNPAAAAAEELDIVKKTIAEVK